MSTTEKTKYVTPELAERLRKRQPITKSHDPFVIGYTTRGGSYMLANNGEWTDSGKPRDIAIVLRDGTVIALSPLINPDYLTELEEVFA